MKRGQSATHPRLRHRTFVLRFVKIAPELHHLGTECRDGREIVVRENSLGLKWSPEHGAGGGKRNGFSIACRASPTRCVRNRMAEHCEVQQDRRAP